MAKAKDSKPKPAPSVSVAAPIPRGPDFPEPAAYTVVARRYRPQQLADLIGQEHVAAALTNAITSGRIAHAYLFTGARGVGKTSAARILAKAMNCVKGPTATPCDECDICKSIANGDDVDAIEIDGASNNKVDEARDLRSNVGFRPTRARFKIYIIDEVHMLTTGAFNALLKTLEEPPAHVKFILATTEVQKIPITILSRCQRFDFATVNAVKIFETLKRIVSKEGLQADDEALQLVAKRANGSMRDSQTLLDQLLSFSDGPLTAERVHALFGTAGDLWVKELAEAVLSGNPARALEMIAEAAARGLQLGELTDQIIEHWRGLMLGGIGVPGSPTSSASLDTILAGLDISTTTKTRMRGSSRRARYRRRLFPQDSPLFPSSPRTGNNCPRPGKRNAAASFARRSNSRSSASAACCAARPSWRRKPSSRINSSSHSSPAFQPPHSQPRWPKAVSTFAKICPAPTRCCSSSPLTNSTPWTARSRC